MPVICAIPLPNVFGFAVRCGLRGKGTKHRQFKKMRKAIDLDYLLFLLLSYVIRYGLNECAESHLFPIPHTTSFVSYGQGGSWRGYNQHRIKLVCVRYSRSRNSCVRDKTLESHLVCKYGGTPREQNRTPKLFLTLHTERCWVRSLLDTKNVFFIGA